MLSTIEAKKEFFLTAKDLRQVPRETFYLGFGTGRASYSFNTKDLEEAAIAKYGAEGFTKKIAAREKRLANKRKRMEDEEAAAEEAERKRQAAIAANPELQQKEEERKKAEAMKKKELDDRIERNQALTGVNWELTITKPKRVEGTKASLYIAFLPPDGFPGAAYIDCPDLDSPAYSFGNIHGFQKGSSEEDEEMIFTTKWKVMGYRYTGTLSVRVLPSDQENAEPDDVMIEGKFDCGIPHKVDPNGVQRWSFKGYK
jgi:hypothetical protein